MAGDTMTTLNELVKVFLAEARGVVAITDADVRNGVSAVVRAVRDEVVPVAHSYAPTSTMLTRLVSGAFDEILGDAGDAAAGDSSVTLSPVPAAAFCEWTQDLVELFIAPSPDETVVKRQAAALCEWAYDDAFEAHTDTSNQLYAVLARAEAAEAGRDRYLALGYGSALECRHQQARAEAAEAEVARLNAPVDDVEVAMMLKDLAWPLTMHDRCRAADLLTRLVRERDVQAETINGLLHHVEGVTEERDKARSYGVQARIHEKAAEQSRISAVDKLSVAVIRAEAAEAEVARLREALVQFNNHFGPLADNEMLHPEARKCFHLARKALEKKP